MRSFQSTATVLLVGAIVAAACGGSTGADTASETGEPEGYGGSGSADFDAAVPVDSGSGGSVSAGGEPGGSGHGNATGGAGTGGLVGTGGQSAVCKFTMGPGWLWMGDQEATCEVPTDAAKPCWEAAVCMCREGFVDPLGPDEIESCAGSLFEPRGAITLIDFCRNSPSEQTMSLGEALTGFASAYTTATTSPECEDAPAYF